MSAANRRRGAVAERAVVTWLRDHGWPDARRVLAGDGRQDSDIAGVSGVAVEVKDRVESRWPTWRRQAVAAALPSTDRIVVVRRSRGQTDVALWPACWTDDRGATWMVGPFADAVTTTTTGAHP